MTFKSGVLVVALLFVATSCGSTVSQSPPQTPLESVLKAAAELGRSNNSAVTLSIVDATYLGGNATGGGWYDFVGSQGALTIETKASSEPLLLSPWVTFMEPSTATSSALKLPTNTSWVFMNLGSPGGLSGTTVAQLAVLNPGFALFLLNNGAVSASVASDGSPPASGETRFLVTVSPNRSFASVTSSPGPNASTSFKNASQSLGSLVSAANRGGLVTQLDVWLDAAGNLRQITIRKVGSITGDVTFSFVPGTSSPTPLVTPARSEAVDIATLVSPTEKSQEVPGLDGDAS